MIIREAASDEFQGLGQLMVQVYSQLDGFLKPQEHPHYYDVLANIGTLASVPGVQLLVAVAEDRIIGGVVYYADMAHYGAPGIATREQNASAFRFLAVAPGARGTGAGKALVERCIELAMEKEHAQVVIHTTNAMKIAWSMYEARGFKRSLDLDFTVGEMPVFGFRLPLGDAASRS